MHKISATLFFGLGLFGSLNIWAAPHLCTPLSENPGNHRLLQCGGMKVLFLQGTPTSRAQEAGALLKNKTLSFDSYEFFATQAQKVLQSVPAPLNSLLKGFYNSYVNLDQLKVPQTLRDEVKALALASGKTESFFKDAFAVADVGTAAAGIAGKIDNALGCTSVTGVSDSGDMLFGRNLEFEGVGVWDKHPIMTVILPENGSTELRRVSLGTEGLFYASITGVNEAGIALSVHQNFTGDALALGFPVTLLGDWVLRQAKTFDEALTLLDQFRTGPEWTFVLVDLVHPRAASIEVSKKRYFVRDWDLKNRVHAQTNHLADLDAARHQVLPFAGLRNSTFRRHYAETQFPLQRSLLGLAQIMAMQGNGLGELASHVSISKPSTIQTGIFEGFSKAWLASEQAPTASGSFVGISLSELFSNSSQVAYETKNLSQTSPKARANQILAKEIYVALKDQPTAQDYLGSIKKLSSQTTIEAYLARATFYLKAKEMASAINEAQAGLSNLVTTTAASDQYLFESLKFVQFQALLALNSTQAKAYASSWLSQLSSTPLVHTEYQKYIDDNKTIALKFEHSTGDLRLRF